MANKKRLIDANAPMIKEYFNPQLIDYREFVKECNHFYENPPFPHPATPWRKGLQLAVEIAMRLPKVSAVEAIHGEWGEIYTCHGERLWGYKCSQCEQDSAYKSNYCSNCGAKMDGGNEDG